MDRKSREQNFEVLRIVSILMIIAFHYVYHGSLCNLDGASLNRTTSEVLYHFGEWGVSCFILISGYFLPDTTFKPRKLILLILEIEFYVVLSKLLMMALGKTVVFHVRDFFPVLQDDYWFINVYLLIYILQPFLKRMTEALDKKQFLGLLISQVIIWSVIPTFILGPLFGIYDTEAAPYYNRYLWFIIVFLIGCYLRRYGIPELREAKAASQIRPWMYALLAFLLVLFAVIFGELALLGYPFSAVHFWTPNSTLTLLNSILLFLAFALWVPKKHYRIIPTVASCTLGVYLLHDGALRETLWNELLLYQTGQNYLSYIYQLLRAVLALFIVGTLVDLMRRFVERRMLIPALEAASKQWKEFRNKQRGSTK